jgi:hypothetical protein
MIAEAALSGAQLVMQVCVLIVAAIVIAGVYLSTGIISAWAAVTIRQQDTLIEVIAPGVFLAGTGRLISIRRVGLSNPAAVWLGYLIPELLLPVVMVAAHHARTP